MELIKYPNPILRQKAAKIDFELNAHLDWKDISQQMIKLCKENNGVGLSGPQVGFSFQIFVAQTGYEEYTTFINPRISIPKGTPIIADFEGCLSIPGVSAKVARPWAIVLDYIDLDGNPHILKCSGLSARICQ